MSQWVLTPEQHRRNRAWALVMGNPAAAPSHYLNLPGAGGLSGVSTPDQAALQSGSALIDIQARVQLANWAPGAGDQDLLAVFDNTTNNRIVAQVDHGTGTLTMLWYNPAASPQTCTSTLPTGFLANSANWVRYLVDTAAGTCAFFTAPDSASVPGAWTQLGTTITGKTTTGIRSTAAPSMTVGRLGTNANYVTGRILRTRYLVATVPVIDMDWTSQTPGAGPWTNPVTGEVWTAIGTATVV